MAQNDLFSAASGGGTFPKSEDFEGKLLLLKPSIIETVPGYQNKGTQQRATCDAVIFEDDGTFEVYEDMYFSQAGIVPSCKKALKDGQNPYILGRYNMSPSKASREAGIDTREKLVAALEAWAKKGGRGDKPQFFWGLDEFDENDAAMARKYLATIDSFSAPGNE